MTRTARNWIRGLVVTAAVLVLLVVIGVEFAGRALTERFAEDQLRRNGVAGQVDVTVGRSWWRPTVIPAILGGRVDRIEVRLRDAQLYSIPVLEADYVLEDLQVDVSVRERTLSASSLGSGSVKILIDPQAFGASLGTSAVIEDGTLLIGPDREPAELSVQGDQLTVSAPSLVASGAPNSFQVVDDQLLPCEPEVHIVGRFVELSCTDDQLPGILRNSIGLSSTGEEGDLPPVQLEPPASTELPGSTDLPASTDVPVTTESTVTTDVPVGGNDGGG